MGDNDGVDDYELVETIGLADIINRFSIERIDLLKMDCEGAEYGIVLQSPDWVWSRVGEIRLEYHQGRYQELAEHLQSRGFRVNFLSHTTGEEVGHLRLSRPGGIPQSEAAPIDPASLANLASNLPRATSDSRVQQ